MNSDTPSPVPVHPLKRWLVAALAMFLIVAHALDVFTAGDHWPISSYPMYAYLNAHTFQLTRLFGVTEDGPPHEHPIDPAWMRASLQRLARRRDGNARMRQAVVSYAHSYGWGHRKGGGALFEAYRLYRHTWTLRPDADPDRPPEQVELLFELRREDAASAATTTVAPTTAATAATTPGEKPRDAAP